MKIKIEKYDYGFIADFIELPGSPSIGTGKTEAEAVATLFMRNIDNLSLLDIDHLEINGTIYVNI